MHSPCTHITIEPLRWIGNKILNTKGTISCYACGFDIGEWNWKSWNNCRCETKLKATFAVQKTKIKFVERKERNNLLSESTSQYLSPKSRRRVSRLSGIISRRALRESSPAIDTKGINIGAKHDKKSKIMRPVFASCFNDLSKDLQKYVTKGKIDPEIIDKHWYEASQVFRFSAKCRIIPISVSFSSKEKRFFVNNIFIF